MSTPTPDIDGMVEGCLVKCLPKLMQLMDEPIEDAPEPQKYTLTVTVDKQTLSKILGVLP